MTKKIDTLKNKKKSCFFSKCLCSSNIVYIVYIVGILILLSFGFGLYKRLTSVKIQLESCRSSCRSDI